MKNKNTRVTPEMKEFIQRNGAELTVPELAKLFETTNEIMYNTVIRHKLPFKRIAAHRRPIRQPAGEKAREEPFKRLPGVYNNIRSPYGIYSDTLNIQLR